MKAKILFPSNTYFEITRKLMELQTLALIVVMKNGNMLQMFTEGANVEKLFQVHHVRTCVKYEQVTLPVWNGLSMIQQKICSFMLQRKPPL